MTAKWTWTRDDRVAKRTTNDIVLPASIKHQRRGLHDQQYQNHLVATAIYSAIASSGYLILKDMLLLSLASQQVCQASRLIIHSLHGDYRLLERVFPGFFAIKKLDMTLCRYDYHGLPYWFGPSLEQSTTTSSGRLLDLSGLHTLKLRMIYVVDTPPEITTKGCMMTTRDLLSLAILPRIRKARITKLELDLHEWMGPMTYYIVNFIDSLLSSPPIALSVRRLTIICPPSCSIGQMVNEALYNLLVSHEDHLQLKALASLHIVAKLVTGIDHVENAKGVITLFRYLLSPHPTGYLSHVG